MYENIRDYPTAVAVVHQHSVRKRIISAGIILFCIFFIGFSLYGDGLVGLSDNGDFLRVMVPNRIHYGPNGRTPFAFQRYYTLTLKGNTPAQKLWNMLFTLEEPYHTTQNIFIKLSLLANTVYQAFTHQNYQSYDIFWLGFFYYLAYVGAIGVIINAIQTTRPVTRVITAILFILVFCDVGYVLYFHSFYGEPLQMVTFLWIAASVMGVLSSQRRKPLFIVLFYGSVVFFAGAKYANIPQGMFLSACGLVFLGYYTRRRNPAQGPQSPRTRLSKIRFLDEERIRKRSWSYISGMRFLILSLFGLSLLICRLFYESVPNWMDEHTTYQSVFFGMLKDSPNPQADLEALGLPGEYDVLAGTNAYMSEYPLDIQSEDFQRNFYDKVNKFDILGFYLKHPGRLVEKLQVSCKNSVHIRPVYLGNYDSTYERPRLREEIGLWSSLRTYLPFNSLPFILLVFILSGVMILLRLSAAIKSPRAEPGTFVFLVFSTALMIINAMNLVIPVVANGEADLAKHMFAFVMGFDLQVLGLTLWIAHKLKGLWVRRKKYAKKTRPMNGLKGLIWLLPFLVIGFMANSGERKTPFKSLSAQCRTGDIVVFGSMDGKPLLWRVIDRRDETFQLFALQPVTYAAYSSPNRGGDENRNQYGSNFWPESDLRKWLNEDFLACFSPQETKYIEERTHAVILSDADRDKATIGDRAFFWTHVPEHAAYGADRAYCLTVTDKVTLLDVAQYAELYQKGLERRPGYEYWLETPYYNNSSMVRIVNWEGYVLMKDAAYAALGVRPCITVNLNQEDYLEAAYDS